MHKLISDGILCCLKLFLWRLSHFDGPCNHYLHTNHPTNLKGVYISRFASSIKGKGRLES